MFPPSSPCRVLKVIFPSSISGRFSCSVQLLVVLLHMKITFVLLNALEVATEEAGRLVPIPAFAWPDLFSGIIYGISGQKFKIEFSRLYLYLTEMFRFSPPTKRIMGHDVIICPQVLRRVFQYIFPSQTFTDPLFPIWWRMELVARLDEPR